MAPNIGQARLLVKNAIYVEITLKKFKNISTFYLT